MMLHAEDDFVIPIFQADKVFKTFLFFFVFLLGLGDFFPTYQKTFQIKLICFVVVVDLMSFIDKR